MRVGKASLLWLTSALAAGAFAAEPAAEPRRAASGDGAFSIAYAGDWAPVRGLRGRVVELARKADRLLVAGEWRDGSTAAPTEAQQDRLRGGETALLARRGPLDIRYERRPTRRRIHLQGRLSCGGDRYLFDGWADRDEELWRLLESFRCEERRARAGLPIGGTGWSIVVPPQFQPMMPLEDARGSWKKALGRHHDQFLSITSGSEIWSRARPWPDPCGKPPTGFTESATQELRQGKTAFRYVCGSLAKEFRRDGPTELKDLGERRLVYLLVYDYDSAIGQAAFIRVALWEYPLGRPDQPLFARVVDSLERSASERAPPPERKGAGEGAVPLLR